MPAETLDIAPPSPDAVVRIGELELRPREYQALLRRRRLALTVREFEVFAVLVHRHDHVVPRAVLYAEVWGGVMPRRDRSVDVFVRRLRLKLAAAAPGRTLIHTHFGIGYRFSLDDDEPAPAD